VSERWLGPGEMAQRLGVSRKALRVYEREGLVVAARTSGGWRVYGPAQVTRLHQVMALRSLGIPLKRIKTLLVDGDLSLAVVLALQRESLTVQRSKISAALRLVEQAMRRLKAGQTLSLDDLTHLTQETVMQNPSPMMALRAKAEALFAERSPGVDINTAMRPLEDAVQNSGREKAQIYADFVRLAAECKEIMRTSAEDSEAAKDFVRRYLKTFNEIKAGPLLSDEAGQALRNALVDAMDDPLIAEQLPFDPAVFRFVARVVKTMKANGELGASRRD
jgi:MerR family transcriptional regulator, thiopeptide resistance regulator